MKCTPITIADIVPGKAYIAIDVALNGRMGISYPSFYGKPIKYSRGQWIRTEKNPDRRLPRLRRNIKPGDMMLCGFRSVSDFGLDPERRHNYHRVFEYNDENNRVLADLVEQQALAHYLVLIDAEDPAEALAELQEIALLDAMVDDELMDYL